MRPIHLSMTAFGPYAQKTEVPFDRLGNGILLITGNTGSGKTTIFDAILFALYGKLSGNRDPKTMRSGYVVDPKEKTEVVFVFDHNGRRYRVRRWYNKEIGDGRNRCGADLRARLYDMTGAEAGDEGALLAEGHEAVRDRIKDHILGVDDGQFRQIIMLAQGQFRSFLDDRAGRREILSRLFDSRPQRLFQDALKKTCDRLGKRREKVRGEIEMYMDAFDAPEDFPNWAHPEFAARLDALIEEGAQTAKDAKKAKDAADRALSGMTERIGRAESENGIVRAWKDAVRRKDELEAQLPEWEKTAEQLDAVKRAANLVLPEKRARDEAARRAREQGDQLKNARSELERADGALKRAQKEAEGDAQTAQQAADLERAAKNLRERLGDYERLETLSKNLKAAQKRLDEAEGALNTAQKHLDADVKLQSENADALKNLDGAQARAVAAQTAFEKAKERLGALNKLSEGIAQYRVDQRKYAAQSDSVCALREAEADLRARYNRLDLAFRNAQAGILAQDLRVRLERGQEALCPVCGTRLCAGHGTLAEMPAGAPSQDEVDGARDALDKASAKTSGANAEAGRQSGALERARGSLMDAARALDLDTDSFESLANEAYLDAVRAEAENALTGARTAKDGAEKDARREGDIRTAQEELAGRIEKDRRDADAAREALNEAQKAEQKFDSAIVELKKNLDHPDRETAQAKIREAEAERDRLNGIVEAHEKAVQITRSKRDGLDGSVRELHSGLEKAHSALTEREAEYAGALERAGFPDEAAFGQTLSPAGEDPQRWIEAREAEYNRFEQDLHSARADAKKRAEEAEGRQEQDIAALKAEQKNLADAAKKAQDALNEAQNRQKNREETRRKVCTRIALHAKLSAAKAKADGLSELAGNRSMTFESYVLGSVFSEILERADEHMQTLSAGRYELVHQGQSRDGRRIGGLDVDVMDSFTQRQRAADTVSGGEGFEISLSLALGLSDAAQARAGGLRVETLFVDEGFGTLDRDVQERAVNVLEKLGAQSGGRQIALISHTELLRESIPKQIRVQSGSKGSTLEIADGIQGG